MTTVPEQLCYQCGSMDQVNQVINEYFGNTGRYNGLESMIYLNRYQLRDKLRNVEHNFDLDNMSAKILNDGLYIFATKKKQKVIKSMRKQKQTSQQYFILLA